MNHFPVGTCEYAVGSLELMINTADDGHYERHPGNLFLMRGMISSDFYSHRLVWSDNTSISFSMILLDREVTNPSRSFMG